jgi:ABC-2 type transport system ATP-binding protein
MPFSSAIKVTNLTKKFGEFTAVDNISFDIPQGQIVGLLGGNGAGKTTTLSMLVGVLLPTSGDISVLGIDMLRHRHDALEKMNFSSPYVDLPSEMTIRENLTVFSYLYNVQYYKDRIRELAEELDLTQFINKSYGKLSAGQKTRVLLAKSLINSPRILLLDEPTASLDPDTADWIRSYLMAYQQKTNATILLASHNMQEVERVCHNVIMMKQGIIADRGTPQELVTKYGSHDLEQVFLHIARRES